VSDGVEQGYIMKVERRGFVFKTWEGDMILSRALTDTVHVYQREFAFSVAKTDVAEQLQEYQSTGRQVRVGYKQYLGTLPWRGASTVVVTSVTPVDDAPQCAPVEALATADEE
jgi:hypothetical protein